MSIDLVKAGFQNVTMLPTFPGSVYYSDFTFTHEEFEQFCTLNPKILCELEPDGRIKIMSPLAPISGNRENEISADLTLYARKHKGKTFSSSTGFTLPDGSVRSPDASYLTAEQLSGLTKEDLDSFTEVVPVFVVEVLSPSDRINKAHRKMRDSWIENGVRLAWLIDVENDKLWIYRANGTVELVTPLDKIITGEDVLPGFEFDLNLLT